MTVACVSFATFLSAFTIHWIWWRVRVPRRQTAALLLSFMAVLTGGLAVLRFLPLPPACGPWGFWPCLHVASFHVAMTLAYVVAYSALEERSPSMTLLVHVAAAGDAGRSRAEMEAALLGLTPVETRLVAMNRDGMIEIAGDRCQITPKGRAWAAVFGTWHRLIRFEKGG